MTSLIRKAVKTVLLQGVFVAAVATTIGFQATGVSAATAASRLWSAAVHIEYRMAAFMKTSSCLDSQRNRWPQRWLSAADRTGPDRWFAFTAFRSPSRMPEDGQWEDRNSWSMRDEVVRFMLVRVDRNVIFGSSGSARQ